MHPDGSEWRGLTRFPRKAELHKIDTHRHFSVICDSGTNPDKTSHWAASVSGLR